MSIDSVGMEKLGQLSIFNKIGIDVSQTISGYKQFYIESNTAKYQQWNNYAEQRKIANQKRPNFFFFLSIFLKIQDFPPVCVCRCMCVCVCVCVYVYIYIYVCMGNG